MEMLEKMASDILKESGASAPDVPADHEDKIPQGVTLEEVSEMIDAALNKKGYATQKDIDGLKTYISDVVGAVANQGNDAGSPANDDKGEE